MELYLDYACPWSYLALTRLTETAIRTGARIVFRPVVLDWILAETCPERVGKRAEDHPAKTRYRNQDLDDWARYCGVVLRRPDGWPADSEPAARGAVAADAQNGCAAFSKALYGAYFAAGKHLEDTATLAAAAQEAGLDMAEFEAALSSQTVADHVRSNCDTLLARGGFGTPTLFVADRMFFGNDRMPLVEFEIGQLSGRHFVAPGNHSA